MSQAASIDKGEIAQFSRHAADWWNTDGAMRPLHKLNPARLEYIRDQVCGHYGLKSAAQSRLRQSEALAEGMAQSSRAYKKSARESFKDLSILDVGCGGGILCEPMARLGASVTGLDASSEAIEIARAHAAGSGLKINYRAGSAEDLALGTKKYDVVTALEILEHVADIDSLLHSVTSLLKPGGIAVFSTLNRTPKSWLLGIVAAEYILKWVPRGTHDWRKFIRPSELAAHLDTAGLRTGDITGMIYDPLNDRFLLRAGDVGMNYLMTAIR